MSSWCTLPSGVWNYPQSVIRPVTAAQGQDTGRRILGQGPCDTERMTAQSRVTVQEQWEKYVLRLLC